MAHFESFYSETLQTTMSQVDKRKARKLFNAGTPVYMHPCKMRFDNVWQRPMMFTNDGSFATSAEGITEFDNAVNHFTNYNCDGERGRYPHFYITE